MRDEFCPYYVLDVPTAYQMDFSKVKEILSKRRVYTMDTIHYTNYMKVRKRLLPFVFAFIIFCIAIFELIYLVDPTKKIELYTFIIEPLVLFFILLFFAGYLLFTYIFLNSIKGVLFALFIVFSVLLRVLGYTSLSYIVILFFILVLIIFLFPKRLRQAVRYINRSGTQNP